MHPGIRGDRDDAAGKSIAASAARLAKQFGLTELEMPFDRDPEVRRMLEREAVAAHLGLVADAAEAQAIAAGTGKAAKSIEKAPVAPEREGAAKK